ncbi:MAG: hypothetical protein FWF36_08980 [Propionibacteriaceae bacterium]|nr:hypothetical protein [Propionibacteriaceae bacterium]
MKDNIEKPDLKEMLARMPGIAAAGYPLPDDWPSQRVAVTTESGSCHLVDLTQGRYRRLRSPHDPLASDLRQDGEAIELLAARLPTVSKEWTIWLTGLNPLADFTERTTTPVVEVEWLGTESTG